MKNSKEKSKEWWEVVEEYLTKELEKNSKIQVGSLSKEFSNFHLWQPNMYKGIGLRWKYRSKAQWNSSWGGIVD